MPHPFYVRYEEIPSQLLRNNKDYNIILTNNIIHHII